MPITLPSNEVIAALEGSVTKVTRRVEFYESDEYTRWFPEGWGVDAPLIGGSVSIDASRDERRGLSLQIHNESDNYRIKPSGLWYDKIIKVYRGVEYSGGSYEACLGVFHIDNLSSAEFPKNISISARDKTKLLRKSKFATDTSFSDNDPVTEVVRAIAFAGGVPAQKMNLAADMGDLNVDIYFDQGSERWSAIEKICTSYGYDVFFDSLGILTTVAFGDPATQTPEYTFQTGPTLGNLAKYSKQLTDERIRNHIVVSGENAFDLPIYAEAENTETTSPTSIKRLGRRTESYRSGYINTVEQAQELADVYLAISSLEQYEVSMESLTVPYIDVGIVVGFLQPDAIAEDPTEFLLQSVNIPLGLGTMSATAGRVTLAG